MDLINPNPIKEPIKEETSLSTEIIKRTLRVPAPIDYFVTSDANGESIARRLDATLMTVGFKLSGELLKSLSDMSPSSAESIAGNILDAARELVGDQVKHNVYFKEFPKNVPNTHQFWLECLVDALQDPDASQKVMVTLATTGTINLLDLPKYGNYQHTYEEMLEVHEDFIPSVKDRLTVLHCGRDFKDEVSDLYHSFASSTIPLNDADRELLQRLSWFCLLDDKQPDTIPVRENRAVINAVRIQNKCSILIDTVTDVLRLACQVSGGDVTLQELTKFKSFSRLERRIFMIALNEVIKRSPSKLADVNQYRERWKRLGERIHPHEYTELGSAQEVFAVAREDKKVRSLAGRVELSFQRKDYSNAIALLSKAPGMLFRNIDRLLRERGDYHVHISSIVKSVADKVSGRVILSVREHLQNREDAREFRMFPNKKGTTWVTPDAPKPLDPTVINSLCCVLDDEIARRLPASNHLVVNRDVLGVAVPLSDKNKAAGFKVMPRGSVAHLSSEVLRFFTYWKETKQTTDYDLSAVMLNEEFKQIAHISWTALSSFGAAHSGDITRSAVGASEFIDFELAKAATQCKYIVPSLNVYSGESFDDVETCFFGFMERTLAQQGKPFEPATVRMKSDIKGDNRVVLPLVFINDSSKIDGKDSISWTAKWMNLALKGSPRCNTVEKNRLSTSLIIRSIVERRCLKVGHIAELMRRKTEQFSWYEDGVQFDHPITYVGLEVPENLPADSKSFTMTNLHEIIPA